MASTSETRLYNDLLTSTWEARHGEVVDNITKSHVLLNELKEHGLKRKSGGATVNVEVRYQLSTAVGSYAGLDTLDTSVQEGTTMAIYSWRQHFGTVSVSGIDMAKNSGKEASIDLVKEKVDNAMAAIADDLTTQLHNDGTGNSSKDFLGLQSLVATAPATGTVGGINRANESWWRNRDNAALADTPATTAGTTSFAAKGIDYMDEMLILVGRGPGRKTPHLIYTTELLFRAYKKEVQPHLRISNQRLAGLGFKNLEYEGIPVVHSEYATTGLIYFLNFDFLQLYILKKMFDMGKEIEPSDQDGITKKILTYGNLIVREPRKQGVLAGLVA